MTAIRCIGEASQAGWRRASLGHAQCLALEDISQTHHRSFSAHTPVCFPSHAYFLPATQLTPTALQSLPFIFSTLLSFRRHVVSPRCPTMASCQSYEEALHTRLTTVFTAVSSATLTTWWRRTGSTLSTHSSMVSKPSSRSPRRAFHGIGIGSGLVGLYDHH
jgi:hypothetical protein